jgi:DNA-binding HxlR family transcriptional regulator
MQRTDLSELSCPIARSLQHVGEWWSMLILRDAVHGLSRFDDFQKSLGIAPNILTRRLNGLVESGLLERKPYSSKPLRYEYVLTPGGRGFQPVLVALLAWGNKHLAPEGASVVLVDRETGKKVDPVLIDAKTGKHISDMDHLLAPGPAASPAAKKRLKFCAAKQLDPSLRPDFLGELVGQSRRL